MRGKVITCRFCKLAFKVPVAKFGAGTPPAGVEGSPPRSP
jgi:hypothetical protein